MSNDFPKFNVVVRSASRPPQGLEIHNFLCLYIDILKKIILYIINYQIMLSSTRCPPQPPQGLVLQRQGRNLPGVGQLYL